MAGGPSGAPAESAGRPPTASGARAERTRRVGGPRDPPVEGCLPAAEAGRRGGSHPARVAQEPSGARARRERRPVELRGAAPAHERACRRRRGAQPGRGRVARARGAGATMTRPLRIGLTGPIGCGKSTIASWLRDAGGVTIDADELARAVTDRGEPALAPI